MDQRRDSAPAWVRINVDQSIAHKTECCGDGVILTFRARSQDGSVAPDHDSLTPPPTPAAGDPVVLDPQDRPAYLVSLPVGSRCYFNFDPSSSSHLRCPSPGDAVVPGAPDIGDREADSGSSDRSVRSRFDAREAEAESSSSDRSTWSRFATEDSEAESSSSDRSTWSRFATEDSEAESSSSDRSTWSRFATEDGEAESSSSDRSTWSRFATEDGEAESSSSDRSTWSRFATEDRELASGDAHNPSNTLPSFGGLVLQHGLLSPLLPAFCEQSAVESEVTPLKAPVYIVGSNMKRPRDEDAFIDSALQVYTSAKRPCLSYDSLEGQDLGDTSRNYYQSRASPASSDISEGESEDSLDSLEGPASPTNSFCEAFDLEQERQSIQSPSPRHSIYDFLQKSPCKSSESLDRKDLGEASRTCSQSHSSPASPDISEEESDSLDSLEGPASPTNSFCEAFDLEQERRSMQCPSPRPSIYDFLQKSPCKNPESLDKKDLGETSKNCSQSQTSPASPDISEGDSEDSLDSLEGPASPTNSFSEAFDLEQERQSIQSPSPLPSIYDKHREGQESKVVTTSDCKDDKDGDLIPQSD